MERESENRLSQEQGEPSEVADPTAQSSLQRAVFRYPQHAAAAHQGEQKASSQTEAGGSLPRSPTPTMKTEESNSASPSPPAQMPLTSPSGSTHEANPPLNQMNVALKMLVSNSASGLIIGRSGSTISDLQAKSRTRIKLSQGGDYYPGTSDRVCLIQGSQANASLAAEMVLAKLYELQSLQQLASAPPVATKSESASGSPSEGHACASFIVRLLVPSTCCGMIIGRGGSNIKSLKERSEVTYIQLSPKEHEVMVGGSTLSTSERIMTVTGPNFSSCVTCVKIILNDMAQNPEISRYINMTTSYSKNLIPAPSSYAIAAPASGFFLEHEPFQQHLIGAPPPQILESPTRYGMSERFMPGQFGPSSPDQNMGILPQQLLRSPGNYDPVPHGDVPLPLRGDPSAMVPSQPYGQGAISALPRLPDPGPSSSSYPQYRPQRATHQAPPIWSRGDAHAGSPGILPSASGNLSLPSSVDQLARGFQAQASIQRHHSHSSLQHLASPGGPVTKKFGVPDNRIGSILGRGGKTLTEIQGLSQTKIRISQRGDFIPGTQNHRVVFITGDTAENVRHAEQLVNKRLAGGSSSSSSPSELQQLKDG
mmetsp:Transcript_19665/g.42154  ORF Transcript_19665/g.42154 Transcript_19665/m.42154 type:complete len:595 (+) Transcript_19665:456-2240(+)